MSKIEDTALIIFVHNYRPYKNDGPFLIIDKDGTLSKTEMYDWDNDADEFYGNIRHHIPFNKVKGWISVKEIEEDFQHLFTKFENLVDGNNSQG